MSFGERLAAAFDVRGPLCVGIDPHASLLADWGLPDSAVGAQDFSLRVVDAVVGRAGIIKPNVGFFERFGSAGYRALEQVLAAARGAGLVVIIDVKRGDLDTSVDGYGEAWLTRGSPLEVDAMTAVAYQGVGSLRLVLDRAAANDKGVFVLAATSNPEARDPQTAQRADGVSVAAGIVRDVTAQPRTGRLRDVGVVIGGTVRLSDYGIDPNDLVGTPILAPGFGHQGARFSDLPAIYGPAIGSVVPSASRSILSAGPDGLKDAVAAAAAEVRAACRA